MTLLGRCVLRFFRTAGGYCRWCLRRRRTVAVMASPSPRRTGNAVAPRDGTVEHEQPPPSIETSSMHLSVVPSHSGCSAGHIVSSVHWTQLFVVGSQIGVSPGHSELFEHSLPHVFVVVLQVGSDGGQSALLVHFTHFFVMGSQTGASPGHSELFVQLVPHVWVVVSQIGFGSLQSLLESHSTQRLVTGSQTGTSPGHCELTVHSAIHVLASESQTGLAAGQSAPVTQPAHLLLETSHTGVAPAHAVLFVAVHCTQNWSGSLHAGAMVVQLASLVQPNTHSCEMVLHTPVGPVHCVSFRHCTHLFVVVRQAGSPGGHASASVALHSTHLPATHAGTFGS
jgi:hypothetical protein